MMESEIGLYVLASIGAIVVTVVGIALLYLLLAVTLFLGERFFEYCSKKAFIVGDGDPRPPDTRHPKPPWDRLWIEFHWCAGVFKWLQMKARVTNYSSNPASRPDLERLYELREEEGDVDRSTLAALYDLRGRLSE